MMQNHYFDQTHEMHPYTHSAHATPGTIAPFDALREDIPPRAEGKHPAEKNGKWIEIEDHRGRKGYVSGISHTIQDFGPLPDGWSDTPPPLTTEELFVSLRSSRDSRLAATDKYLLPDYPISEGDLALVKAYRAALRDLPDQLGAPWDGGGKETPWPELPKT